MRRVAFAFELRDLNSIKQNLKGDLPKLTFILRDGTNLPTLAFHENNLDLFVQALLKHVQLFRAAKDNNLIIVRHHDAHALQNSWNTLNLFSDSRMKQVSGFISDPYGTTMSGLAKVGGVVREMVLQPTTSTTVDELAELMGDLPNTRVHQSSSRHTVSSSHSHGSGGRSPDAMSFDASAERVSPIVGGVEDNSDIAEDAGFEVVYKQKLPPRLETKRGSPITYEQWLSHFDGEGKVKHLDKLLDAIFRGGLAEDQGSVSVRRDAYKFLLGYYDWKSTDAERMAHRQAKHLEYRNIKKQWELVTTDQESRWTLFRERRCLLDKDVARTDRTMEEFKDADSKRLKELSDILMTYIMYNFDLGYVQGMNDLLAPLLLIMQDEADAFWCFVGYMNKVGKNFDMDQGSMKEQLSHLYQLLQVLDPSFAAYLDSKDCANMYFCFRWLLVWFKREFSYADTLRLWEVTWAGKPCSKNFHLLLCLAILDHEKVVIMENHFGLTEILKHVNDLSMNMNVDDVIRRAEGIFLQFCGCPNLPDSVKAILDI